MTHPEFNPGDESCLIFILLQLANYGLASKWAKETLLEKAT